MKLTKYLAITHFWEQSDARRRGRQLPSVVRKNKIRGYEAERMNDQRIQAMNRSTTAKKDDIISFNILK